MNQKELNNGKELIVINIKTVRESFVSLYHTQVKALNINQTEKLEGNRRKLIPTQRQIH